MDNKKMEYVFKFLDCGKFAGTDISKNTGISQSVVYWYLKQPKRIYNAKVSILDALYLYFKSFGFDENKLDLVSRETKYTQFIN